MVSNTRVDDDPYDPDGNDRDDTDAFEPRGDAVARRTAAGDDEAVYVGGRADDDAWLTTGLAWTLLAAGLVLLLVPNQ